VRTFSVWERGQPAKWCVCDDVTSAFACFLNNAMAMFRAFLLLVVSAFCCVLSLSGVQRCVPLLFVATRVTVTLIAPPWALSGIQ